MNHVRPITILGALYRLLGKIVFKAVAKVWNKFLPYSISGGLPSRGVKDLAFQQKISIESSIAAGYSLGGMSLDLQKAFNTFGRRPFVRLFEKLGIPVWLTIFGINCLSCMQRCPQHRKRLGSPIPSTTGIPEGDCLSVLGMIALSALFSFTISNEFIRPYTYADNWAWRSLACRPHFIAFQQMLALTSMLRVLVDFAKSWQWSTNKDWRKQFQNVALYIPHEKIKLPMLTSVKDLGEQILYNKMHRLGFIKNKISEAISRIHRVGNLPCSIQTKCRLIQSSAWSVALYAADTMYIGHHHFNNLRSAATHAIVGKGKYASLFFGHV